MSKKYQVLNYDNFDDTLAQNAVVVVDFWATWCGPCKMLAPIIEQIAEEFEGRAVVGKVDVDDYPKLAERYSIMSIPAIFIFKNGNLVNKLIGFRQKEQIAQAVNAVL